MGLDPCRHWYPGGRGRTLPLWSGRGLKGPVLTTPSHCKSHRETPMSVGFYTGFCDGQCARRSHPCRPVSRTKGATSTGVDVKVPQVGVGGPEMGWWLRWVDTTSDNRRRGLVVPVATEDGDVEDTKTLRTDTLTRKSYFPRNQRHVPTRDCPVRSPRTSLLGEGPLSARYLPGPGPVPETVPVAGLHDRQGLYDTVGTYPEASRRGIGTLPSENLTGGPRAGTSRVWKGDSRLVVSGLRRPLPKTSTLLPGTSHLEVTPVHDPGLDQSTQELPRNFKTRRPQVLPSLDRALLRRPRPDPLRLLSPLCDWTHTRTDCRSFVRHWGQNVGVPSPETVVGLRSCPLETGRVWNWSREP